MGISAFSGSRIFGKINLDMFGGQIEKCLLVEIHRSFGKCSTGSMRLNGDSGV